MNKIIRIICINTVFGSSTRDFYFINNKVEEKKFFLRRKEIIFIGHNYLRQFFATFYYYFLRRDKSEFEIYRMIHLPVINAFF